MFMSKWTIVCLLLVLFTAGCIEEKIPEVTTTTFPPTTTIRNTCTDSDGGKNYYVKGDVTWCIYGIEDEGCALHTDMCKDENVVLEYYCQENELRGVNFECPNGCENGACVEKPELTTTTTMSKRCRFLNFQIKSHAYRNGNLTLYFHNIGSEEINDFDVHLYFTNKTSVESFIDQSIPYHVVRRYDLDVGPGLDNVTVVEIECGKSYFVNV